MNNVFINLLMGIANKRGKELNKKTLLVDGIEYIVYMDACYFSLVPVNEELDEMARWLCVPFETERAEAWREKRKSIRILDWS